MITIYHYLFISIVLFSLGIYAVLTRKNAIGVLMGIELILNSASLNFVTFSHYIKPSPQGINISGQIFAIFIIVLAASEVAVALAIILAIYKYYRSINVDVIDSLKG